MTDVYSDRGVGRRNVTRDGLRRAVRDARDPVLLGLLPLLWAAYYLGLNYAVIDVFGFDFRGTIWEPARAFLDGAPMHAEPTVAAVEIGNPAVYPPLVPMLAAPLGLMSETAAVFLWSVVLAGSVVASLRLLDVRDWRCYAVALTAIPVMEGLFWGNITLLLLVPLALAWRYRDRPVVVGLAVGAAVAAKLFLWPVLLWLLFTRRYKGAVWAVGWSFALVIGPWALIGFDGLRSYPELLDVLQGVYAVRSFSVATVAAAAGPSVDAAVAIAAAFGVALVVVAGVLARRPDGDRRSFSMALFAAIVASPVVWPYYVALLFVPVAVLRRRLSPLWFFGWLYMLVGLLPQYSLPTPEPCCRPADTPPWVWAVSQTMPRPWQAVGGFVVMAIVTLVVIARQRRPGDRLVSPV